MAKSKYWNGTSWEVVGTDAEKVSMINGNTVEQAITDLESCRVNKSSKDSNGIFKIIEYRRKANNTLAAKSVLSGGTSPKYTTRTVTLYAGNGTTVVKTNTYTLSYDSDGDLISEV